MSKYKINTALSSVPFLEVYFTPKLLRQWINLMWLFPCLMKCILYCTRKSKFLQYYVIFLIFLALDNNDWYVPISFLLLCLLLFHFGLFWAKCIMLIVGLYHLSMLHNGAHEISEARDIHIYTRLIGSNSISAVGFYFNYLSFLDKESCDVV